MLQLLWYMLQIWDSDIEKNDDLTLVIPIVVYQGESVWKHYRFEDLFPGIDGLLMRYLPCFTYERTDANQRTEAILASRRAFTALLVFQTMRHVSTKDLGVDALISLLDAVIMAADYGNSDNVLSKGILTYIFNFSEVKPLEIFEKVRLLSPSKQENYMSILNQFYIEGINLGKAEGINLGKVEGIFLSSRIIKRYQKGKTAAEIAASLDCDINLVIKAIEEFETED